MKALIAYLLWLSGYTLSLGDRGVGWDPNGLQDDRGVGWDPNG